MDLIIYLSYHIQNRKSERRLQKMNDKNCSFTEKINGVTFIVNAKSADNANKPVEEYIRALITDEVLSLEPDVA